MASFLDDFNRADGPVGNGWSQVGAPTIQSNRLRLDTGEWLYRDCGIGNTEQCLSVVLGANAPTSGYLVLFLRGLTYNGDQVRWTFYLSATGVTAILSRILSGVPSGYLGWGSCAWTPTNDNIIRVEVSGLVSRCYVNGVVLAQGRFDGPASGLLIGLYSAEVTSYWDNVNANDSPGLLLTADVTEGANPGDPAIIVLTGKDTAWTPGTPGSPVFTSLQGGITAQTVDTPTQATLEYTPPDVTLAETITDPSTGGRVGITFGVGTEAGGGGGGGAGQFTEQAVTQLTALGSDWNNVMLGIAQSPGWETLRDILLGLFSMLELPGGATATIDDLIPIIEQLTSVPPRAGYLRDAVSSDSTTALVEAHAASLAAQDADANILYVSNAGSQTLNGVRDAIRGLGGYTVADVIDAIAAIRTVGGWTLADVLTWIQGVRSESSWSLESVRQWIVSLRGAGDRDHTQIYDAILAVDWSAVLDAIEAMVGSPATTLAAILAAVQAIPTNPITSLQPVLDALAPKATSAEVNAIIPAVQGSGAYDLTEIHDQIAALPAAPATLKVYPGLAGITQGSPVPFSGSAEIAGPMDGCFITLTAFPPGAGGFAVGDHWWYYRVGHWAFVADSGAQESWQYLGGSSHLVMPQRMSRAASLVVHCAQAVGGTVTPFTIDS